MPLYLLILKVERAPHRRIIQLHHNLSDIYAVVDLLREKKKLKSFQIQTLRSEYAN